MQIKQTKMTARRAWACAFSCVMGSCTERAIASCRRAVARAGVCRGRARHRRDRCGKEKAIRGEKQDQKVKERAVSRSGVPGPRSH